MLHITEVLSHVLSPVKSTIKVTTWTLWLKQVTVTTKSVNQNDQCDTTSKIKTTIRTTRSICQTTNKSNLKLVCQSVNKRLGNDPTWSWFTCSAPLPRHPYVRHHPNYIRWRWLMARDRVDNYNSTPIIEAARKRALLTLDDPNPKLTKLEHAFRQKYLQERIWISFR